MPLAPSGIHTFNWKFPFSLREPALDFVFVGAFTSSRYIRHILRIIIGIEEDALLRTKKGRRKREMKNICIFRFMIRIEPR